MKIPTHPVHRLAKKPGIPSPLYSQKHSAVVATNGSAIAVVKVDQEDEDVESMVPGHVPPDAWAAACDHQPAKGTSDLQLNGLHARLKVYDVEGVEQMSLVLPRDRTLFDEQVVDNLVGLMPARKRGANGVARVNLCAHTLQALAAALGVGAADYVHLELHVDIDGVVRKPVRVVPAEIADDDTLASDPDRVGALQVREGEPWSTWLPDVGEPEVSDEFARRVVGAVAPEKPAKAAPPEIVEDFLDDEPEPEPEPKTKAKAKADAKPARGGRTRRGRGKA